MVFVIGSLGLMVFCCVLGLGFSFALDDLVWFMVVVLVFFAFVDVTCFVLVLRVALLRVFW